MMELFSNNLKLNIKKEESKMILLSLYVKLILKSLVYFKKRLWYNLNISGKTLDDD